MFVTTPKRSSSFVVDPVPSYVPPKRSRVSFSDVGQKIELVASTVGSAPGFTPVLQQMLREVVYGSLGPKQSERDEYQADVATILGKVLSNIEATYEQYVAEAQAKLRPKIDELAIVQAEQAAKEGALAAASAALAQSMSDFKVDEERFAEAMRMLLAAQGELRKAEAGFQQVAQEKARLDDVYHKHFLVLKESGGVGMGDAMRHVEVVEPLLRMWGVEDCLLAGFRPAASHKTCDRGEFCHAVMLELEKFFQTPMAELEMKLAQQQAIVAKCQQDVAEAEARCGKADPFRVNADREAEREAMAALSAVKKLIADALRAKELAEREVQLKEGDLERFRSGPLAAYQWLLTHMDVLVGYAPSRRFMNFDVTVQDKVTKLAKCMKEAPQRSEPCREMLAAIVYGSLGPGASERNDIQAQLANMLRAVLSQKEVDLQQLVTDAEAVLSMKLGELSEVQAQQAAREGALVAASAALAQSMSDFKVDEERFAEAMRMLLAAQGELRKAEAGFQQVAQEKARLDDVYHKHFLVLKESGGVGMGDAMRHVEVVEPLLRMWGVEDCLLAGFRPAASHRTCDRGEFCHAVMLELEKFFQTPMAELEMKLAQQQAVVAKCQQDVAEAEARCGKADPFRVNADREAEREAMAALSAVKKLIADALRAKELAEREVQGRQGELASFIACCVETYQWLLQHA